MSNFLDQIQGLSPKRLALLAYELNEQVEALKQSQREPIAIVGMGCRFPGGVVDPESYWHLLQSGRNPITEVPPDRWDVDSFYDPDPSVVGKTYARKGGFLDQVDQFDPEFFGISPREALAMDPQQRLLLEVGWEALESGGYAPETLRGSPTGVYVAIGIADYVNLQTRAQQLECIDAYSGSGSGFCFAAGRLSYVLGLQGPSLALDAACSSSLIAVHLACQSLRSQECDQALAGGVNLILSPESNLTFSATRMISTQGRCQTFDAEADGFVRSEGCAVLMLKRLSDAVANHDNILAVIKGTATNHGGASGGLTVPSGAAQQTVIRRALQLAGVVPADVQYVEAHGTGTPLGDPIEVRALGQVYKDGRDPQEPLLMASVKTNIGHTEVVSGMASLIKVVLAMQHQTLPPHLHFQSLNPEINLADIPAKIPTQVTPWPNGSGPRLAAVNSFGMSGTNAHAILAEAPTTPGSASKSERPLHLLPLSAKTPQALRALIERYDHYLETHPDVDLANLCFTAGVGRSHFQYRWAVVAASSSELRAGIQENLQSDPFCIGPPAPPSVEGEYRKASAKHRIFASVPSVIFIAATAPADLFAIGAQLYRTQATFRATIDRCNDILKIVQPPVPLIDLSISAEVTVPSQPNQHSLAMNFAIQVGLVELWHAWGIRPTGIISMSGGTLLASWMAGIISLEQALQRTVQGTQSLSEQTLNAATMPLYWGQTGQLFEPPQILNDLLSSEPNASEAEALYIPEAFDQHLFLVVNGSPPPNQDERWLTGLQPQTPIWNTLLNSLATLYQQGVTVGWDGFEGDYARQRLPLPTYPFQRQRYWSPAATQGAKLAPQPSEPSPSATTESLSIEALQALDPAAQTIYLETQLTARIAKALGVKFDQITPQTPLQSVALDSIMAIELKFDLEKALGRTVELSTLLSSPTIEVLATQIIQGLDTATAVNLPKLEANPTDRDQPFPLNEIQRAYWLGRNAAFELGNVAAHIYAEYDSPGLDCDGRRPVEGHRIQTAFQRLISRHDALRTIVLPNGQQQVLNTVPAYEIPILDLSDRSPTEQEEELAACRDRLSHEVRDPQVWPLFSLEIVRLGPEQLRVLFSIDNLLVDGSSLSILCAEWGQLYADLEASLPPLDITFRDYVLAMQSVAESELGIKAQTYWQQRLATLPPGPTLPLAIAPETLTQPKFRRLTHRLPSQTWQSLQQQGAQHGLTPSGILLAAYAEVLATWSSSRHFCLNLTTFNRLPLHPQVQDLVGDFTNLTLLAIDYREPTDFAQRAIQVQHQLWQDLEHSTVSGVTVLRDLMRANPNAQPQMMPVVFTSLLANAGPQDRSAFGTQWLGELVYGVAQTPQVWFDHQVYEDNGDLVYNWDVVAGLFPAGMVEDMFAGYGTLLENLAQTREPWSQARPVILPSNQTSWQATFNQTQVSLPGKPALLHDGLVDQAGRQPDHLAVITTELTLTYRELYQRANQVGQRLRQLGMRPHEIVAISMDKGWEQVVAVYGALFAGAVYLPLDPGLPKERREHLLVQAGVKWVLSQQRFQESLAWPVQVQLIAVDDPALLSGYDAPLESPQQPTDLAYVIYTSGSTGQPKGVMIDHRGALNTITDLNQRYQVGPQDRVLALSSLSFDLSVYDIFGVLTAGGTLVIPPTKFVQEPNAWIELMQSHQVTLWNTVPAFMQMLTNTLADQPDRVPSDLRLVLMSGDWIPLALPGHIQALWPQANVISLGGATEASIWSIHYPVEQVDPEWGSIPYGLPLGNQQVYVLDEQLQPCPWWVPGHLYIGGVGLAQGYWNDPEKTAASFIQHPASAERLYRTGDLGRYLPSGVIEFLGREDFQVKVRGHRIELGEIEAALDQHPDVRASVVLVRGEGSQQQLVACVVALSAEAHVSRSGMGDEQLCIGPPSPPNLGGAFIEAGAQRVAGSGSESVSLRSSSELGDLGDRQSLEPQALIQFLGQKLPSYMVPEAFLMLEELPLTINGKVDRRRLLAVAEEQITTPTQAFVAPRNALEMAVADVWSQVLERESIGVYDNFFELGGDSLVATQLMARLRSQFQTDLPLRTLFQDPTIANVAQALAEALAAQVDETLLAEIAGGTDE